MLVETLVAHGVTHVFGMVGHSNLGFADALRRAEERGELTYIGIRHEGAAAFAASAYGKLTGRPAACFAIAGPGSTNLLTGLYDAKLDQSPVIAISGQVPSKVLGRGAFQDLDLSAVFKDVAISLDDRAGGQRPRRAGRARGQARASTAAASPTWCCPTRCRPCRPTRRPRRPDGRLLRPADPARRATRSTGAAELVARRPAAGDRRRPRRPRRRGRGRRRWPSGCSAPVLTTFKAKGLVPDTHPLGAGVLGRSGTPVASWLMNESDLLVVVGASFSNHTGIAPYKPIVQIDDDPAAIGRFDAVTAHRPRRRRARPSRRSTRAVARRRRPRTSAPTSPSGGRSGGPRRPAGSPTTAAHGVSAAAVFDALSRAPAGRRGRHRRRRQPRLLARAATWSPRASRC